jgi:hypothetical protein
VEWRAEMKKWNPVVFVLIGYGGSAIGSRKEKRRRMCWCGDERQKDRSY